LYAAAATWNLPAATRHTCDVTPSWRISKTKLAVSQALSAPNVMRWPWLSASTSQQLPGVRWCGETQRAAGRSPSQRRRSGDSLRGRRRSSQGFGVEGSNPFARSSPLRTKLSPPFSGPRKSPTAAGVRATGLGVRSRNDTPKVSPNAVLSPELESRPFYSASFFAPPFRGLASL
jgi:hypothetical protein